MNKKEESANSEYNPRLRVSDHLSVMQGWKKKSSAARKSIRCSLNVRYGSEKGETLDMFPSEEKVPVLIFIHGGYWRGLDKGDFSFLAPPLVSSGVCVIMPNYDLAPAVTIGQIVEQSADAVGWVYSNAAAYGGDPERIFISGHSAGAHLAAMMMTLGRKSRSGFDLNRIIKGGLGISGIYDLKPLLHAGFLKDDLMLDEKKAAELSPVSYMPSGNAPLWTCAGGDESGEFKRQTALIGAKWKSVFAGDIPMPGCNHFTIMDEAANPDGSLFKGILKILNN